MSSLATPPPTSLSPPPSPTELSSYEIAAEMTPIPRLQIRKPIYLIVATTVSPPLGIGLNGSLPWGPLRADMAFFRRVTTESRAEAESSGTLPFLNVVIMGRKTWESIPPRFRPLKDRLNIILARSSPETYVHTITDELRSKSLSKSKSNSTASKSKLPEVYAWEPLAQSKPGSPTVFLTSSADLSSPVLVSDSIESALEVCSKPSVLAGAKPLESPSAQEVEVGNVFVIGGSEIYRASLSALAQYRPLRVLQTQVKRKDSRDIECDTFFSEELEGSKDWQECGIREVEDWVGVKVPQGEDGWKEDGEMNIRVVGWERKN